MSVSVVVPVYNEPYVETTIDALLEQCGADDEIIAVNDENSDDAFTQRLQSFCADKEVVLITGESTGASGNRMRGVEAASNEKIAFIDADCRPAENWLSQMNDGLTQAEIVEGAVIYDDDERCPLDRIIENRDAEHRFLTANMGVQKQVFDDVGFDDRYRVFREDTDFAFTALNNGFTSMFDEECVVYHKPQRYSALGFLQDQLRYVNEPLFYNKFADDNKINDEISAVGSFLYPLELAVLTLFASLMLLPYTVFSIPALSIVLAVKYQKMKMETQDCRFCPRDFVLLIVLIPSALVVKRYAIWKGALRHQMPVI
jgi:glycosyltransferase involved in cell wall biosynthesis